MEAVSVALQELPLNGIPGIVHGHCSPCSKVNGRDVIRQNGAQGRAASCRESLYAVQRKQRPFRVENCTVSSHAAAFLTQTVCLDDTTVKFEIWDTAGQERYHSLAPMYYRGAQAAIVVYDITNTDTFARAKNWVKELQRQASPNIVIALAGNKADLANKRAVDYQEAQAYADDNSLLFMETSAKTAMNVNEIFMAIAKKLPKNEPQSGSATGGRTRPGVDLQDSTPQNRGGGQCCSGN